MLDAEVEIVVYRLIDCCHRSHVVAVSDFWKADVGLSNQARLIYLCLP